ncbi:hypothetical protein BT63DRAFT_319123 [Microthyrium microscopicum]|uniref:Zn(2)-C6 fungal-type domain-containing protein n=1 Tax=Microthyrium microscopicum TaxID=703497 RepID=A0A6A6U3D9_9PEZI|nr:hypothetical protein BT63DRAFT_319123 [Microthyrium microscopicum]
MVEATQRPATGKNKESPLRNMASGSDSKISHEAPSSAETPPRKQNGGDTSAKSSSPKKRRKVNHACIYCRRSHMTCDLERPCTRCIKRNIGHLCHDEPRDQPKKMRSDSMGGGMDSNSPPKTTNNPSLSALLNPLDTTRQTPNLNLPQLTEVTSATNIVQPTPVHAPHPTVMTPTNPPGAMNFSHWMYNPQNQLNQDINLLHTNSYFNTSEVSNEFSLLNDFLSNSLLDDSLYTADDMNAVMPNQPLGNNLNTLNASNASVQAHQMPPPSAIIGSEIQRPASGVPIDRHARERYLLMAADPTGSDAPEERLKKLLKAKFDAGLLKPFNYVKGYKRMGEFLEKHVQPTGRMRILKQLDKFRPKFRELIHPLTDEQLVYVEVGFERKLMEYDRILSSMAIPACCWRRTGEIYRGNKEMAELIHAPMEQLRDGKLAIHEIFAETSLVMYWENFGAIAFDSSQKAVLTMCVLKNLDPRAKEKEIKCSFSFTIRRDQYNIPSLIVGNFLPILPPSK